MARWRTIGAAAVASMGLTACADDPAFWDNVAYGLDTLAWELENQPVCNWYTDAYGIVRQYCQPAYMANQPVYVAPVYVGDDHHHHRRHDRRDRRRDRDGRRDGGHRGNQG